MSRLIGRGRALFIAAAAVGAVLLSGCGGDDNPSDGGGSYDYVELGGLKWMKKNLNIVAADSWCYGEDGQVVVSYDKDGGNIAYQYRTLSSSEIQANCNTYGRLYTWAAATKACPKGWRLSTKEDWDALADAVSGRETAGKILKAQSGWTGDGACESGNGTDNYGFSALPGGDRTTDSLFLYAGHLGIWWTATERDGERAYYYNMNCWGDDLSGNADIKSGAFSVRCVAD